MDFFKECEKLLEEGKAGTAGLIRGADFDIDVRVANGKHKPRLHICSRDEFTYVLSGEVEMLVDGQSSLLKAGEGILVKAGVVHNTLPREGASWMLIAAPHKHHYLE